MWSQIYATEILRSHVPGYVVSRAVGNAMPSHHTRYDIHDIHILWNRETRGYNQRENQNKVDRSKEKEKKMEAYTRRNHMWIHTAGGGGVWNIYETGVVSTCSVLLFSLAKTRARFAEDPAGRHSNNSGRRKCGMEKAKQSKTIRVTTAEYAVGWYIAHCTPDTARKPTPPIPPKAPILFYFIFTFFCS